MPHLIYELQVPFFEGGDWKIGMDLHIQLARCFSFDPLLLGRLMATYAPDRATQLPA
jgi:hypothetical protein